MFWHNFIYSFKTLFRNKMLIFWTFAFPILLGLFFNMAFSDIEKNEKLDIIDIAIVNNSEFNNNVLMKNTIKELSDKDSKERLFSVKYVNLKKADSLLKNKKISGYILLEKSKTNVIVRENGIDATVLKYVVDEINGIESMIKNISTEELSQEIYQKVFAMLEENIEVKDISLGNLSYTVIEFYTLIAMACLYGGILGMVAINQNLANMGSIGKKMSITPISKRKMILGSVLASYITQLIGVGILLAFLYFVLRIDFGTNPLLVVLLTLAGSLAGLSLGILIATLIKKDENTKTGIVISITMLGCFLSGMMGITMKYIVDKNIPILNKINPASMITDGFYSLYYYDTLDRYIFNLVSLLIFSIILIAISCIVLRRQKYDSI